MRMDQWYFLLADLTLVCRCQTFKSGEYRAPSGRHHIEEPAYRRYSGNAEVQACGLHTLLILLEGETRHKMPKHVSAFEPVRTHERNAPSMMRSLGGKRQKACQEALESL